MQPFQDVLNESLRLMRCPVCMSTPSDFYNTSCGHCICGTCINVFLKPAAKAYFKCPVCKAQLTKRNVKKSERFVSCIAKMHDIVEQNNRDLSRNGFKKDEMIDDSQRPLLDASFLSPNNDITVGRSKSYSNAASSSIITRGTVESEDPYEFQLSQRPGNITPRTKKRGTKRKKRAAARWSKKPRNTSGGGNSVDYVGPKSPLVNVTATVFDISHNEEETEFIQAKDVFRGSDGDSDLFGSPEQSISGAVGQRTSLKRYNTAKGKVASNKSTAADRLKVKRHFEGSEKPTLAVGPRSRRSEAEAQKYTSNLFDDITDTQEVKIDNLSLQIDAADAELLMVESTSKSRPNSKDKAKTEKPARNSATARRQEQKIGSETIDTKGIEPTGGEISTSEEDVTVPSSDVVEATVASEVTTSSVILFHNLNDDDDFACFDDSPEETPALVNSMKPTTPTSVPRSILSSQGFVTSDLGASAEVTINDTPVLSPERSRVKSLDRILESASLEDESKSPVRNVRSRCSGRLMVVAQRDSSADAPSPIVCHTRRTSMRVRDADPKHYEELASSSSSTLVISASIDVMDKKLNFTPNLTSTDSSKKRLKSSKSGSAMRAKRLRKSVAEPDYDSAVPPSAAVPDRITSPVSHQEGGRRQVNDQAFWNMEQTLTTKIQELQREVQEQSVTFQQEMKKSLREQLEKHYLNVETLVNNKVQTEMVMAQEQQSSVAEIISNRFDGIKSSLLDEIKNCFETRVIQHTVPLSEVETMIDKETITTQKDETDECIQTEVVEAISVQTNTDIIQFIEAGIQPSVSILPASNSEASNDVAVTSSGDMFDNSACSVNQLSPGFLQALDEGALDDIVEVEDEPDESTQPECSISAVSEVIDSEDLNVLVDEIVESTENRLNSSDAFLADAVVRAEEAGLTDTPDVVAPVLNIEDIEHQVEAKQSGSRAATTPVVSPVEVPPDGQYVICYSNLSHEQKLRVATFMDTFKIKLIRTIHPVVTHLIIAAEKVPGRGIVGSRTVKFMQATVGKKWIVNQDWVDACIEKGKIVDEEPFEVNGDTAFDEPHYGPRKSRTDSGRIFDCVNFWILPPFAADIQTEIGIALAKKYGIPTVNREWTLDCILSHSQLPFWSELYGPSETLMKLILAKQRTDYSPFDANVSASSQN